MCLYLPICFKALEHPGVKAASMDATVDFNSFNWVAMDA